MKTLPSPLNGVILKGIGVDSTHHLRVVARVDHDVARNVGDAERNILKELFSY